MSDNSAPVNKEPAYNRDWTQGPVLRNILLLSWPMALLETMFVISQLADLIWVGRLGPDAIASMGIAFIVTMLPMSMDFGLVIGSRAIVARFVGAGDIRTANHVTAQGLLLGTAWGLLISIVGISLAGPVVRLFGQEPGVTANSITFIRIAFAGWVAQDIMIVVLYIVQSSGDVIRPLIIETLTRAIHITLCPLLVLGIGFFPNLGIGGAALASVIGQLVGALLALGLLFGGGTRLHITRKDFRPDFDIILRILKIGFPGMLSSLQRSGSAFVVTLLVAPFGKLAMGAHSIYTRVEMFVLLPGFGLGNGVGVLVGQNLGAGQPQNAERVAWTGMGILQAFMVPVCGALWLWAGDINRLFTTDPALIELGSTYLRISVAGFALVSIASVLQGAITGAGDTIPNMVFGLVSNWVVQIGLALWLPHVGGLGALGIRWAIAAGFIASSIIFLVYFWTGRWKAKKV